MAVGMVMGVGMWMGMGRAPSMLTASSQNNSRMTCSRMSHLSRRFCGAAVPRTKLGYSEARKKKQKYSNGGGKSMTFMRKHWAQQCRR